MSYIIGSFNLRDFNFANQSSDGEKLSRDIAKIAEIIIDEGFDVVALQEINSEMAVKQSLLTEMNMRKNSQQNWDCRVSEPSRKTKDPEMYAYVWNTKRLALMEIPRKSNPDDYQAAGGNTLLRPPYYIRLTSRGRLGGSNFELRLLNVHIQQSVSEQERIQEFEKLIKQVLPRCCDHPGLNGMPAYTFLLGDYNLRLDKGPNAQIRIESITTSNYTGKRRHLLTVQREPTSLRLPNEQQSIEECYANNYDHFTYEVINTGWDPLLPRWEHTASRGIPSGLKLAESRIEALGKYYQKEDGAASKLQAYRAQVSDHVPIKLELYLK